MVHKILTQKKAKKAALDFINYLKKEHGMKVERAYLFGSYAKKQQHEYSDVDVCSRLHLYYIRKNDVLTGKHILCEAR